MNELEIKKQICEIGRRIYDRNMVAANDGNISVKLNDNEFLCTPTGISKGYMTTDCICKIDGQGNLLEATGNYKPSSEMKMHLRVYEKRPDVGAVVHAHPIYATAFAIDGIPLDKPIGSEMVLNFGYVPVAPYGTPSTNEIPDSIEPFLDDFDALLLANHGALTWSVDLLSAYLKMESLEFFAQTQFVAMQLGTPKVLSDEDVAKLYSVRRNMNMPGRHPALHDMFGDN